MNKTELLNQPQTTPSYSSEEPSQTTQETISSISARAQEFASEKKEQLYEKFDAAYSRLQEFSKNGHWTWRTVCFCASLLSLAFSILTFINVLSLVLAPINYVINAFILVFSLILVVFEFPKDLTCLQSLRNWFERWAKAFARLVGRGLFYVFLGTIMITVYGWLGWIIGALLIAVGVISLIIGIMLSMKLRDKRNELQTRFGNDFSRIQEQFNRFDTDGNGLINSVEFAAMCHGLGLNLTDSERDYALDLLDKDRDGAIDVYEFAAWFNSRGREFC